MIQQGIQKHEEIDSGQGRFHKDRKDNNQGAALRYLAHDLIDTKSRVILRRKVTRATSRAEREAALEMDELEATIDDPSG